MPCPRCGCRLVSPGTTRASRLVCSDCGHPMDTQLRLERPPWGWRELGAALAVALIGLSAMGLLWLTDTLSRQGQRLEAPPSEQQNEAE